MRASDRFFDKIRKTALRLQRAVFCDCGFLELASGACDIISGSYALPGGSPLPNFRCGVAFRRGGIFGRIRALKHWGIVIA